MPAGQGAADDEFRLLVEHSPVCIHQIDLDGRLMSMNRAGIEMLGLEDESDIVGVAYLDSVCDEDRPRIERLLEAALDGESSAFEFRSVNGRSFESSLVPIRGETGAVTRLMGLTKDISQRKEAEARAWDYQARLRRLTAGLATAEERERRRIATELNERISQTLAAARMKASQALREATPSSGETLRELTDLLDDVVTHIRSVTHEISPPMLEDLGWEAAVQWLTEEFCAAHELRITFVDDERPKPLGEPLSTFLFKAVRELLLNVVKHARATSVEVRLERKEGALVITVTDDGVGIPADQRADWESADGLGLFSVLDRLDYYGGSCEIESVAGEGTKVVLTAPLDLRTEKASRART